MTDRLQQVIEELRAFVEERHWEKFHDPKNLAMLLASEAGELLAEYRWVANGDADDWSRDPENRARIEAEIGDVGIALLMLCDRVGVDVAEVILRKMEQNKQNYPLFESKGVPERGEGKRH